MFFSSYDGFRFTQLTQSTLVSIPTLAERAGDFSALISAGIRVYDPNSCSPPGACTNRTPFPNNMIQAIESHLFPAISSRSFPNPTNDNLQSNYLEAARIGYHDNSTTNKVHFNKVDFNVSEKHTF